MSYEDFHDQGQVEQVYCKELGRCLLDYMGATSVQIFDAVVWELELSPIEGLHHVSIFNVNSI